MADALAAERLRGPVLDIDVYRPPHFDEDYHAAWLAVRDNGAPPVFWTPRNGGHWIATRPDVIEQIYEDWETFSNRVMLVPKLVKDDEQCPRHIVPSYVDPPEHRPYRRLLNDGFAPATLLALRSTIRDHAAELIDSFVDAGHCDFRKAYAQALPIRIFMKLVDLPMSDAPMLAGLVDHVVDIDSSLSPDEAKALMARVHSTLHDYVEGHIDERIGKGGTDMLSRFVNGTVGGRPLTRQEMIDMCTQVLFGGLDTVVNFLGFVMLQLAGDADLRHRLATDKAAMQPAIDEFLRRYPAVTVGREVRRDVEIAGAHLRKGDMIMAPTALVGLDAGENPDPLRFDPTRRHKHHITFGKGVHRCPGAPLARLEIQITIEEWLRRIPDFAVAAGEELRYRGGVVGGVEALHLVWPPRPDKQIKREG